MLDKPEVKQGMTAFSTRKKYAWFHYYRESSNFDKEFDGTLECTNAFQVFEQNRIKNIDGFKEIKTSAGENFSEKLNAAGDTEPGGLARRALTGPFTSNDLEKAQKTFTQEIARLNKMLSSQTPSFSPGEVGNYLIKMKSDATSAIKAQHTLAKEKLTLLFEDDTFTQRLRTTLGENVNLDAIKNEMFVTLEKTHKEAITALEKSIEESANKLFFASKLQYQRLAFLGDRFHRDSDMANDMRKQMPADDDAVSCEYNSEEGNVLLRNVDIDKLTVFNTIQGFFLGRTITKNPDGSFSMQLNRIYQTKDSVRQEFASLVQGLLAQGKEVITLKLTNSKDLKKVEKEARLAYEGAIEAGADPKKIIIEINGEVKFKYTKEGEPEKTDLFKGREKRLQIAQDRAAAIEANVNAQTRGTKESNKAIKNALNAMIEADERKPGLAPQT